MSKVKIGDIVNMLTVIGHGKNHPKKKFWLCLCQCGNTIEKTAANILTNQSGCGCKIFEVRSRMKRKHGGKMNGKATPTYNSWLSMKGRCLRPSDPYYKIYGEAGITVCERWKHSFINFLEDMGERPEGHTLDRRDNAGNYEPENCKWSTIKEQNRNRSDNAYFIINGEKKCLSEWCEVYSVSYSMVRQRVSKGWDIIRALTTPSKYKTKRRAA